MSLIKKSVTVILLMTAILMNSALVLAADCLPKVDQLPVKADLAKLRQTWLDWNNELRQAAGLSEYSENEILDMTANSWSETALDRGFITHKRDGQKAYYDYQRMIKWFKKWGVEFESIKGATFTENIGWGYYKCPANPEEDCTENLTKAIRTTFDFFAGEKRKKYRPHYDSLMKKHFEVIGVGIKLDNKKHKYFLTVHYGAKVKTDNLTICQ